MAGTSNDHPKGGIWFFLLAFGSCFQAFLALLDKDGPAPIKYGMWGIALIFVCLWIFSWYKQFAAAMLALGFYGILNAPLLLSTKPISAGWIVLKLVYCCGLIYAAKEGWGAKRPQRVR